MLHLDCSPRRPDERPLVIAHRGGAARAPENTLAALRRAAALRVPWAEVDVRLTKDRHIVVYHDQWLRRLTKAAGALRQRSLAQLEGLRVKGEPIPTLTDSLACVAGRVGLLIEIKEVDMGEDMAGLLRTQERIWPQIVVMSFHTAATRTVKALLPPVRVGHLFTLERAASPAQCREIVCEARGLGASLLCLNAPRCNPGLVHEAHRAGLSVWAWTVKSAALALRLARMGVDGLIADDPERIMLVVQ